MSGCLQGRMKDDKEIVFPKVRDNILSVIIEFFCLIAFNSSSKIRIRSPIEDLKLKNTKNIRNVLLIFRSKLSEKERE